MGFEGDVDVAAAAALIGEPARAALLVALTEAESLPARELAARAGIAPRPPAVISRACSTAGSSSPSAAAAIATSASPARRSPPRSRRCR